MKQEKLMKIKQGSLTASAKLLWLYILTEGKQVIDRKASDLAEEWGIPLSTYRRGLKELIEAGIIRVVDSHPLCPRDSIYHRFVVEGSTISLVKRNPLLSGSKLDSGSNAVGTNIDDVSAQ